VSTAVKSQLDAELLQPPLPRRDVVRRDLFILLSLSVVLSAARWCTLNSFWGDSPRWIFEAYRGASGELLYRDFAWQYPPLPLLLCSGALHLLGSTFWSVQLLLDIVSAVVVILTWDLGRRLLPKPLPLLAAAAMAAAGASNTSNFALFSLQVYTPAILIGMIGLLVVLREIVDYLRSGTWKARGVTWLAVGAAVCLLSKPEYILGLIGCLAALALADLRVWYRRRPFSHWLLQYTTICLACFAPSLLIYAGFAVLSGPRNVLAGVGGYGLAALSCPWWPTGLGLFGALAALGYGVMDAALLSLTRLQAFKQRFGSRYSLLWAAAAVSLVVAVLYLPFCAELPMFQGRITVPHALTYFLSTGTVLLPVMWFSILLCGWLAVRLFQSLRAHIPFSVDDAILFSVLSAAVLMSLRGLFSGTMTQLTLASVAAYPIWFLIGPYLLIRVLERAEPNDRASRFGAAFAPFPVTAVIGVFLILRLLGVVAGEVRRPYARVVTPAGTIRLKDTSVSPQVYAYVANHSSAHEPILDLAGGGGINLADRRPSPIFSTQFTALEPPARYLQRDMELIRQHPPRLIIASAGANFGATYGICMNTGCTFPALVWRSTRPACDATRAFPVLDYVRQNYEPSASFGDKIVYSRRGSLDENHFPSTKNPISSAHAR